MDTIETNETQKPKMNKYAMLAVALLAIAMAPLSAALLTFLVQLLGGVINITPAFAAGAPFGTASVIASMPANISGSIINNLAAVNKTMSVRLTPSNGTLAYGAANEITTMDLVVGGTSHTFLGGECIGGATLVCTTISPMSIANGTNTIDVIITPHMLFDPAQSPVNVSVSVN